MHTLRKYIYRQPLLRSESKEIFFRLINKCLNCTIKAFSESANGGFNLFSNVTLILNREIANITFIGYFFEAKVGFLFL